jgi:uncharacterized Zn-binding protein involved in type VI secretion
MSTGNADAGNLLRAANARALTLEQQPQGQPAATDTTGGAGRALDVVTDTHREVAREFQDRAAVENSLAAYVAGIESTVGQRASFGKSFVREAQSSAQQAKSLVESTDLSEAEGPLGKAAAALGLLVSLEQVLSGPFSLIPFPALPAVRVGDLAIGFPHGHMHPPTNGLPWPSIGPVIPLPWGISGAEKTLINGRPAARCGDLGIGIWCGGWFPLYEILLGSSSVWIEGARAARLGVDLTLHCLFSGVPKPSDIPTLGVPLGCTVTASQNVIIGGFPLPSLTSLLLGVALRPLGIGLSKLVNAAKKAAREAAQRAEREAAERAAREAPHLRKDEPHAGAEEGLDPTEETIRIGTVRMEDHPNYIDAIRRVRNAGFEVVHRNEAPHVVIRRVVDREGNLLRIERELIVQPGMRYLDLEHELDHIRQGERFVDPPPTDVVWQRQDGTLKPAKGTNLEGSLTNDQNAVMEYHVRMVEFLRLHDRGASPELLESHARGVEHYRREVIRRGAYDRRKGLNKWREEHFSDLGDLARRYNEVRRGS